MTLFFLSIWCVGREFSDAVDSMLYLSLSIHWQFQGLRLLCFGRWFMDQPWHSVFDNSMRRPWLYFCFPFDASVVNSLTLSIPCCTCHSVFIDDFKIYYYSLFACDLWTSREIAFFTILCVGHDSIFAFHLMRRSWIHWRCRFHGLPVTQYSLTISRSTVTLFLPAIYVSIVTECFFHFHASTMTLFLLSTLRLRREFIDGVDSMVYLSLSIHWRFQSLRLLCFCRRFMDQPWHSIFDNSMRRPWLYFFYRFDVSVVNSLTLSIPCCTCHSVFIDHFKVYYYSVLVGDLWSNREIVFFTIPCVGPDYIFAFHLMRRSWIH